MVIMILCNRCKTKISDLDGPCIACGHRPERVNGFISFLELGTADPDSYDPSYFDELVQLEERNFWFSSRNRLILFALHSYCSGASSFFEVGCGTGYVLSAVRERFPQVTVSGGDRYPEGLAFAAQRLRGGQLYLLDMLHLPFRSEFDVLGGFDVLEHVREDEKVLAQMYQALRKGGILLITVPQHPFLWSSNDGMAKHVRRYRKKELQTKAERAGFRVVRMTGFVSLLLPLMILSRMVRRRSTGPESVIRELKQPAWLNELLVRILTLERLLIGAGVNFPFGGSLLLVAQKV